MLMKMYSSSELLFATDCTNSFSLLVIGTASWAANHRSYILGHLNLLNILELLLLNYWFFQKF